METICIVLDPEKMSNPDLDIRYILPDRVDEFTEGKAFDNGYDYLQDSRMVIWLDTEDSAKYAEEGIRLISSEKILDNDLTTSAEVYISPLDCAELEQCTKVFPVESVKGRETAVFAKLCES